MHAYFTDHFINQTVTQFFSNSLEIPLKNIKDFIDNEDLFVSYGILRGTGEIIKNRKKNFIYLDHGYFQASSRKFTKDKITILSDLKGYFRIIKDDLYFNSEYANYDPKRFNLLNIELKQKKEGDLIILSEPTKNTLDFLEIDNWTENTVREIRQYSDREIVVHNKFSGIPLKNLLEKAFAFVSLQSTAGFHAITEGVPTYFTHDSLKKYGDIKNIENKQINHNILYAAANSQWKLNEFFTDEFREYINTIVQK